MSGAELLPAVSRRQRLALVLPWPTAGTTFGFVADLPPPTATPGIGFDVVRLESQ